MGRGEIVSVYDLDEKMESWVVGGYTFILGRKNKIKASSLFPTDGKIAGIYKKIIYWQIVPPIQEKEQWNLTWPEHFKILPHQIEAFYRSYIGCLYPCETPDEDFFHMEFNVGTTYPWKPKSEQICKWVHCAEEAKEAGESQLETV